MRQNRFCATLQRLQCFGIDHQRVSLVAAVSNTRWVRGAFCYMSVIASKQANMGPAVRSQSYRCIVNIVPCLVHI